MNIAISNFFRSVSAEAFKLKRTPILWISIIGGVASAIIVFLLFFILTDEFIQFNQSPWLEYYEISYGVLSLLLIIPYIVLVTSTVAQAEHKSNAWKYLYALPLTKGNIYFSKLFMTIILIAFTHLIFFVSTLVGAYILDLARPVFEFSKYTPDVGKWAGIIFHSFIAILGVTAIQYWLSVRWSNMIIPIAIGIMAFLLSIMILGEDKIALFFPYCYPMYLSTTLEAVESFSLEENMVGGLVIVEWYSLAFFALFSFLGYYEQRARNVK